MATNNKKLSLKSGLSILLIVVVVLGSWAYFELREKGATYIDNPGDQDITVQIDDKTYAVPAGQFVKAEVSLGEHKLSCRETGIANETFQVDPCKQGVINPTRSKYVIYNIIYTEKDLRAQFKPYEVDGKEVYSMLGEPELNDALFIPDRTMGNGGNIDVKEPSIKSYSRFNQDYSFLTKIFRLKEFFEFYDKHNQ
ncbi:MAG: hypothetical protein EOP54_12180 [Sphingobacteriales bacterium]|nr:MAG: hypothetical protein EOP54_12180 [Sphingobacteriales bacterium]